MAHNRTPASGPARVRLIPCLLLALPLVAGPAMAAGTNPPAHGQPGSGPAFAGQQAQLAQRQTEVERLRQHVDQLENQNGRASARLQQQDRDIAELRRQLQAARSAAPAGPGHR